MEQVNEMINVMQKLIVAGSGFTILFQLFKMQSNIDDRDKHIKIIRNVIIFTILSIVVPELTEVIISYY